VLRPLDVAALLALLFLLQPVVAPQLLDVAALLV